MSHPIRGIGAGEVDVEMWSGSHADFYAFTFAGYCEVVPIWENGDVYWLYHIHGRVVTTSGASPNIEVKLSHCSELKFETNGYRYTAPKNQTAIQSEQMLKGEMSIHDPATTSHNYNMSYTNATITERNGTNYREVVLTLTGMDNDSAIATSTQVDFELLWRFTFNMTATDLLV